MNREEYLINRLSSKYIGDDGAIVGDAIYSIDAFFENVHFKREWMSLKQIARKAMLVNISDAIAMSAKPKYALVTLSLPKDISLEGIDEIEKALSSTAKEFGCEIIGGDTIVADGLNFSIAIISYSKNPLTRKGLQKGDLLAYTGVLGESKRDLEKLLRGDSISSDSRFIEPKLRGEFIDRVRPYIKVGMDISDGLFCDTNKLLDFNNIGFESLIDIDNEIGSSGEEYEMLIGFSANNKQKVMEIAKLLNLELTIFAKIVENSKRFECINHHN